MSNTQLVVLSVADERSARDLASILSEIDRRDENVSIVDTAIAMKDFRGKPQTIQLKKATETRGGSFGNVFGGITSVFRETGIDENILRKKAQILEPGQVSLFVLYIGTWDKSRRALRHALNTFGISLKDGQPNAAPTTNDDFTYRPSSPHNADSHGNGSHNAGGYDAGTDDAGQTEFEGETFGSSIDWPSTGTFGEWTELEGEDPYFGEDSAGFDDDPIFGAESAVADVPGDYTEDEPFYGQPGDDSEESHAQVETPFDELPDEPAIESPVEDDSEFDAALDEADTDAVAQRTKEQDIALYRGLGDVSPTADEDWLIEEVNKYDAINKVDAIAEASRAALIAGAAQAAEAVDVEVVAEEAAEIAEVMEVAGEADQEQGEALLEASVDIAEQSDQVRAFGSMQRETGLELEEIAAELEEFSQEVREQELALLSSVLSNRGEKLQALAKEMVSAASSASELAGTLDGASQTIEELGVNEVPEGETRSVAAQSRRAN